MRRKAMKDKEKYYDKLLNIHTLDKQKGFNNSSHYFRYEPTPYSAFEFLFNEYKLNNSDHIVDFGCGKGRLNFIISHLFDSYVTGIEMNEKFFLEAKENLTRFRKKHKEKINFNCCLAEEYPIDPLDNKFYFFNPFSIQIFMTVINNILLSVEKVERDIELILYFASNDYIYFLENDTSFELQQEIRIPGLYEVVPYERFLIYRLSAK